MEEAEDDHLPSMETAAMVGRWKARAVRKMRFAASPTSSFTRKSHNPPSAAAEMPGEEDSGRSLVHGAMRFPGSRLRPAKWARVSQPPSEAVDTTQLIADTMQLITRTWGLRVPSSLISIIGSSDRSERYSEQLFGPALKRAAETTNAWILTDGSQRPPLPPPALSKAPGRAGARG